MPKRRASRALVVGSSLIGLATTLSAQDPPRLGGEFQVNATSAR